MDVNRQWRVARLVEPGELLGPGHFAWQEAPPPVPADGEVLMRTLCLSTSPAQRGYISINRSRQLLPDLAVGEVMRGRGIGVVVESRHPDFRPGELYDASLGWQDYSIQRPREPQSIFSIRRVDDPVRPLTTELGLLGNAGMTAFFGLLEVGQFRPGESVLVSAAAGGVGSVVGQLARIRGAAQVVGLAGSDDKCRWLVEELGFSAAINYKREDLGARLRELHPRGFDVYFDNVGGAILDTCLLHLAMRARVVVCGWISVDYAGGQAVGPVT